MLERLLAEALSLSSTGGNRAEAELVALVASDETLRPSLVEPLSSALRHDDWRVRRRAAGLVGALAVADCRSAVEGALASETNRYAREALASAAKVLDGAPQTEAAPLTARDVEAAYRHGYDEAVQQTMHTIRGQADPVFAATQDLTSYAHEIASGVPDELLCKIEGLDEVLRRYVRTIRALGDDADYTAGRVEFSVGACLEDAVAHRSAACSVPLSISVEPTLTVCWDREALYTIVCELIANAQDACAGGDGGTVLVRACRDCEGNLVIAVEDTGIGIEAVDLGHVKIRGFSRKSGRHLGLGLAQAEASVAARGGTLTLSSTPGEGTVVVVTVPERG